MTTPRPTPDAQPKGESIYYSHCPTCGNRVFAASEHQCPAAQPKEGEPRKRLTPSEREQAMWIANKFLDTPWSDPDSDQNILARQFLRALEREAALAAQPHSQPAEAQPSIRAYSHKAIDRVQEMRKLDLERANDPAQQKERDYYLGRAHRCDDILFWLGELESRLQEWQDTATRHWKDTQDKEPG
jgi:hypothetical protein